MAKWSEWKPAENWPETEVTFKKKYRLDDGNGGGGGIARIAINRPEVLNAMAGYHMGWLAEGVRRASADPSIGVIVIAGEGPTSAPAGMSTGRRRAACVRSRSARAPAAFRTPRSSTA